MQVARSFYKDCTLCPRACHADRTLQPSGSDDGTPVHNAKTSPRNYGICGESSTLRVGRAALHFWEEPCISGSQGSGTVFFSGCSLQCVYCQNYDLARGDAGIAVTEDELASIFLRLEAEGAANINLVTADHFWPSIPPAVAQARSEGLSIPIVWNGSGYESVACIRALRETVDIFLTDFKYLRSETAARYSFAPDYPEVAKAALAEMVQAVGEPVFSDEEVPLMKRGIIVRHLLMPGHVHEAMDIVNYLYTTYGDGIFLSLMNQYTPSPRLNAAYPELSRCVTKREYSRLVDYAVSLGVQNAFIQEGETAAESFIPAFDGTGVC